MGIERKPSRIKIETNKYYLLSQAKGGIKNAADKKDPSILTATLREIYGLKLLEDKDLLKVEKAFKSLTEQINKYNKYFHSKPKGTIKKIGLAGKEYKILKSVKKAIKVINEILAKRQITINERFQNKKIIKI